MRVTVVSFSLVMALMATTAPLALANQPAPEGPDMPATAEAADTVALSPLATAIMNVLDKTPGLDSKSERKLAADIRAFYVARQYEPLWIRYSQPTARLKALAEAMAKAELNALDPDDYILPDLGPAALNNVEAIAAAELASTVAVVRYATHLSAGRIRPRSLSRHVTPEPEKPAVSEILEKLAAAGDVETALRAFEPEHEQYRALKKKLAEMLASADIDDKPLIPHGRVLRHGSYSPRVALLRNRLDVPVANDADPQLFDRELLDAVREFQRSNALGVDGIVGQGTLAALNRDNRENMLSVLRANIERWRWMPKSLGDFHVAVNIPEFRVRVNRNGETVHATRVVVGKRSNPTPVFSDEMEHLIVNPYWNVPTSIVSNEMLPDIMIDPTGFFERHGYELFARGEGRGMRPVHPEFVDWFTIDPKQVLVRQPPGRGNALGRIKFMFPNRHAVYLHDTPTKNLFQRSIRAFSHGCVRVKNPLEFADAILAEDPEWSSERLKRMFGGRERKVELAKHIPVHLTYFTAMVDADGTVETFGDIYGYDRVIGKLTAR
jgi:murein L,D-transpeptidase YcbB/YkuD